jgi:hypothetical protein
MTIWKFPVHVSDEVTVASMSIGAQILCVQMQHDTPCLWALVDKNAKREERRFRIYGTGQDIPANPGEYIGTVQMLGGMLVWHVFEVK